MAKTSLHTHAAVARLPGVVLARLFCCLMGKLQCHRQTFTVDYMLPKPFSQPFRIWHLAMDEMSVWSCPLRF